MGRHSSPAANGAMLGVRGLWPGRAPPEVDEAQVQAIPASLGPQVLQIALSLLHAGAGGQPPALGQPAQHTGL